MMRFAIATILAEILVTACGLAAPPAKPTETILNGRWQFRRDGAVDWKDVSVPSAFQDHEGTDFHGVGWYRKTVESPKVAEGDVVTLHFQAAATHTEVWWNDERLGEHLGGWTPFRFDVTDQIRKASGKPNVLLVRIDERVGHNTQGFLPIIQPHFGGLWQDVRLMVNGGRADDLGIMAIGDSQTGEIVIELPRRNGKAEQFSVRFRRRSDSTWRSADARRVAGSRDGLDQYRFAVPDFQLWSPETPTTYEVDLSAASDGHDALLVPIHAAFRKIETRGTQLLLNGQPLIVRGVLNWGFYPPRLAPMIDVQRWRRDIRLAKEMGFNLMKFCLWVPPKPFLELCDQEGMLAWIEYPTWHPKLDAKHREELKREFAEFFAYDRNHPCIILRSLTCETGPSADINVIRDLYNLCKSMIPGSVVEDDSSWIGWNRIHDFYDDHPYGNNHTWIATLQRLRAHIDKHGAKPLVLGEAIAADTWIDPDKLIGRVGDARSYWLPGFLDGNRRWLNRMRTLYGTGGIERLEADSLRYAMRMRRYQIETYRREVPDGGYVVSVLRDFPLAGMGLLGFDDQPKWSREQWAWHTQPGSSLGTEAHWRDQIPKHIDSIPVARHASLSDDFVRSAGLNVDDSSGIILARRFDIELLDKLERGAKVMMLPDGERGSIPLRDHWFLRGGPYLPDHPTWKSVPREAMVDLQHFDFAGPVIYDCQFLDQITPVVLLWDNHDIKEVKTHALVFEAKVGQGRLFVSALKHEGADNVAGRWLLSEYLKHLDSGPVPTRSLKPETIRRMREKLREEKIDLTKSNWRFRPDPANEGLKKHWQLGETKTDGNWSDIKIGKHWEAQGWPRLDGWAWYRLDVQVPAAWKNRERYLQFEGVDDHYELYVNGKLVGGGGDPTTRRNAFDERKSHKISQFVQPGKLTTIAIRVLDWGGAGGIHRPVSLSTVEMGPEGDLLK